MKPILLLGDRSDGGFAALRTRHFAEALGPDVRVLDHREDVEAAVRSARPRALVSAGNHGPTRALLRALRVEPALPAWVDVAGDPFAEAQAAAGEDRAAVAEEANAVWAPALARGDAFSAVGEPGRDALLGALGVLGRLARWAPGDEPVHVLPCAADFPDPPGDPRGPGLEVALIGGFNTWFDDETLLDGLLSAMERAPVRVRVFGGAIPGHHEAGFARFEAGARASRRAERFRFLGWVPHAALADALADAHVTVTLDRAGPEARLGARTRVLYALHRGLRVLATPGSPVVAEAVAAGLVEALAPAHAVGRAAAAEGLAATLLAGGRAPARPERDRWLAARSVAATTGPLAAWAAAPRRREPAPAAESLLALSAERDRLAAELAALRRAPSFVFLDRVNRLVRRGRGAHRPR